MAPRRLARLTLCSRMSGWTKRLQAPPGGEELGRAAGAAGAEEFCIEDFDLAAEGARAFAHAALEQRRLRKLSLKCEGEHTRVARLLMEELANVSYPLELLQLCIGRAKDWRMENGYWDNEEEDDEGAEPDHDAGPPFMPEQMGDRGDPRGAYLAMLPALERALDHVESLELTCWSDVRGAALRIKSGALRVLKIVVSETISDDFMGRGERYSAAITIEAAPALERIDGEQFPLKIAEEVMLQARSRSL